MLRVLAGAAANGDANGCGASLGALKTDPLLPLTRARSRCGTLGLEDRRGDGTVLLMRPLCGCACWGEVVGLGMRVDEWGTARWAGRRGELGSKEVRDVRGLRGVTGAERRKGVLLCKAGKTQQNAMHMKGLALRKVGLVHSDRYRW